jgi:hypothetical protein
LMPHTSHMFDGVVVAEFMGNSQPSAYFMMRTEQLEVQERIDCFTHGNIDSIQSQVIHFISTSQCFHLPQFTSPPKITKLRTRFSCLHFC